MVPGGGLVSALCASSALASPRYEQWSKPLPEGTTKKASPKTGLFSGARGRI